MGGSSKTALHWVSRVTSSPRLKQERTLEEITFKKSFLPRPPHKEIQTPLFHSCLCTVPGPRGPCHWTSRPGRWGSVLLSHPATLPHELCRIAISHEGTQACSGEFPALSPWERLQVLQIVHFQPKPSELYSSTTTSKTTKRKTLLPDQKTFRNELAITHLRLNINPCFQKHHLTFFPEQITKESVLCTYSSHPSEEECDSNKMAPQGLQMQPSVRKQPAHLERNHQVSHKRRRHS